MCITQRHDQQGQLMFNTHAHHGIRVTFYRTLADSPHVGTSTFHDTDIVISNPLLVNLLYIAKNDQSKDYPPLRFAIDACNVSPDTFAIRLTSCSDTRRTAMALASTKYLSAASSIPLVVRISSAPAPSAALMWSIVMSSSFSCAF